MCSFMYKNIDLNQIHYLLFTHFINSIKFDLLIT